MTCDRCKHIAEISELFRECANCETRGIPCVKCEVYLAKADEAKRIQHFCDNCEAGELHHEIHYDGADGGMMAVIAKVGGISADALERKANYQATGVTRLDPDTESKLRIVLASLMELDPLDLLLVQHVFGRRKMAKFRETARMLRDRLNGYDLTDTGDADHTTRWKANVSSWGKRILSRVPALTDVFEAVKDETAGGGK